MGGTAGNLVQLGKCRDVIIQTMGSPQPDPWTIGAAPPGFTDRLPYLDRVMEAATSEDDAPSILVLCGRPGIGKSALLHKCAAHVRDLFQVGLSVDFAPPAVGSPPPGLGDVLAGQLLDLGVTPEWLPPDLPERRRRYQSMIGARRTLVVIDNLRDDEQARTLLPSSPGSLVLAASELRLDGVVPAGNLVDVRGLDGPAGAELLASVCGDRIKRVPADQVERLVATCDGHPQALRMVGARLKLRSDLDLDNAAAQAGPDVGPDRAPPDRAAHAAFDRLFDDLSAPAARLLGRLALTPGHRVEPLVAAALTEDEPGSPSADELLPELVRASLIDEDNGELILRGLVRRCATDRGLTDASGDADAAARRAVDCWAALATAADLATGPRYRTERRTPPPAAAPWSDVTVGSRDLALAWMARYHLTLLDVLRFAAEQGWHTPVWQVFEALWPYYSTHKPLRSWQEAGELAVAAAMQDDEGAPPGRRGYPEAEARVRCLLARGYWEDGRGADADRHLTVARELAEVSGNRPLYASVLDFQGNSHLHQGSPAEALPLFEEALAINEALGDIRGTGLQALFAGRCHIRLGHHDGALDLLNRARALIAPIDDPRTLSRIELATGDALVAMGNDADAGVHLARSLEASARLGPTALDSQALELLADMAHRRGDGDEERLNLKAALAIHERSGGPDREHLRHRLDAL